MFKQLIEVKTSDADALVEHATGYDTSSAVGLERVTELVGSKRGE